MSFNVDTEQVDSLGSRDNRSAECFQYDLFFAGVFGKGLSMNRGMPFVFAIRQIRKPSSGNDFGRRITVGDAALNAGDSGVEAIQRGQLAKCFAGWLKANPTSAAESEIESIGIGNPVISPNVDEEAHLAKELFDE